MHRFWYNLKLLAQSISFTETHCLFACSPCRNFAVVTWSLTSPSPTDTKYICTNMYIPKKYRLYPNSDYFIKFWINWFILLHQKFILIGYTEFRECSPIKCMMGIKSRRDALFSIIRFKGGTPNFVTPGTGECTVFLSRLKQTIKFKNSLKLLTTPYNCITGCFNFYFRGVCTIFDTQVRKGAPKFVTRNHRFNTPLRYWWTLDSRDTSHK